MISPRQLAVLRLHRTPFDLDPFDLLPGFDSRQTPAYITAVTLGFYAAGNTIPKQESFSQEAQTAFHLWRTHFHIIHDFDEVGQHNDRSRRRNNSRHEFLVS